MKKEGYITVYLSLTFVIMLSLIFTLLEGIRVQTIRFQTECVMDFGLTSIFAEYNREFLEQYGLLAIDTSYGYEDAGMERTKSHFLQYMNMNFTAPGQNRVPGYKDLTALHADNAGFSKVSYISDGKGEVLKYQIIQYMKEKTALSYAEKYLPDVDFGKKGTEYSELEAKRESSHGIINEILNELNAKRKENEDEISIDNPADYVNGMRNSALLDWVVSDSTSISRNAVNLSTYISHRQYQEGAGVWSNQEKPDGMINRVFLQKYLFDKCGYYLEKKENSILNYQLEYLLYGKNNDYENVELLAKQLFQIRYVVNAAYLFGSGVRQTEASELAAVVTSGILSPELYEAVKITILFAWCYAETVQDLRILFDGKKVAEVKSDADWNTPLSELLAFTSTLDSYNEASNGKTYRDYLEMLLFIKEEEAVRMRLMDIMEMDIGYTAGNQNFKLDQCVYQLEADANVTSKYGYGYSITRQYSYE